MNVHTVSTTTDSDLLHQAFRSFDDAAVTLQQSYQTLTTRLEQLDVELADRNEALSRNLRANEELREHLTAILESLPMGLLVMDSEGSITRCNQAGEQLLGLPREQIIGCSLAGCLKEAQLNGDVYPLTTHQGTAVTLSQRALKTSEGRQAGSVLLIQDVTVVRELEDRLQRRNRLAAMGEMVGRIAHEIRNPLGSIELFASMLRRDLNGVPALRGYAEHISSSVHMMNRLLTNLLLYTKPDCSHGEWHEMEVLMLDALTLAAHAIAHTRIDIRLEVNPSASRIWCDAGQMKQVLLNLILNSIHAMSGGGTLTLSATLTEEQASGSSVFRLSVSDTGVGIAAAQRSRIFDPFFTTRDEGTGLGLAIVHAIVEAHRGRIDVESAEGRGTTFTIVLPHHGEANRVETPELAASDCGDGAGIPIMIGERHFVEEETSA
ncbi:MAG: PAS domain S-box protein [Nitrospiraceae bacterium]|nr:MAG: PAS domain S-box protein [Nitrospiraceae bacterium]